MLLRSDEVRKDLVGVGHRAPAPPDAYAPDVTAVTYAELLDRAEHLLALGESVVLDASWADAGTRADAVAVAGRTHAAVVALRCTAPTSVAHERLAVRRGDASDATALVHDGMAGRFAPWPDAVEIDTTARPDAAAERAARIAWSAEPPGSP
jgi:predicted kinase